jgi:DNA ligase-like protein
MRQRLPMRWASLPVEQRGTRTVDLSATMLVPWVLMASYAYYQLSAPLVSDDVYDEWTKRLTRVWWRIKHPHKNLITFGHPCGVMLKEEDYPEIVKGATMRLIEEGEQREFRQRRRGPKRTSHPSR